MSGKFTPGPWTRSRHGDLTGSNGKAVVAYDTGIALRMADPSEEDRANARLIASAPAMHAALEEARQVIAEVIGDRGGVLGRIEAALALSHPLEEKS